MADRKVAIALSGGIDSTAALLRLLDKGYNPEGFTMIVSDSQYKHTKDSIKEAEYFCNRFFLKHHTIDLRTEFKNTIIKYFTEEYFAGRTPNPCLFCNPIIKFGLLKQAAEQIGFEYFATGHYAIITETKDKKDIFLQKAFDYKKDQSYFLSRLPKETLRKIILPLAYTKKEVNKNLLKIRYVDLPDNTESQEICFIPNDYRQFFYEHFADKIKPGNFIDESGKVIGKHKGIPFYTIGQRRGLNIALGKPAYVREIRPEDNTIVVGDKIYSDIIHVENINWLMNKDYVKDKKLSVKIRYRDIGTSCTITNIDEDSNSLTANLTYSSESVTPGQGAVFYDDFTVVASGIIK